MSDRTENHRLVEVWDNSNRRFQKRRWQKVRVGEVLRLSQDELVPADMVLLASSEGDGAAFVETSGLDGETNLKIREAAGPLKECVGDLEEKLSSFDGCVTADSPNAQLYSFSGLLETGGISFPLGPSSLVLRGCSLKNTEWVVGVCVYCGQETKLMLNRRQTPSKRSTLEKKTNTQVVAYFVIFLALCTLCALLGSITYDNNVTRFEKQWGLETAAIRRPLLLLTFWVIYSNLVPISLYVSMEVVKVVLMFFIENDLHMYHEPIDKAASCKASLHEELGQITHIFSDKTGTLTRNEMILRRTSVNGQLLSAEVSPNVDKVMGAYVFDAIHAGW